MEAEVVESTIAWGRKVINILGCFLQLQLPFNENVNLSASWTVFFPLLMVEKVDFLKTKTVLPLSQTEILFAVHFRNWSVSHIYSCSFSFISIINLFLSALLLTSAFKHTLFFTLKKGWKKGFNKEKKSQISPFPSQLFPDHSACFPS